MEKNYYIEIFEVNECILYGYGISTDIDASNWVSKRIKVTNQLNITKFITVMNKADLEKFIKSLNDDTININSKDIICGLVEGDSVLNIDDKSNLYINNNITNDLGYKKSFWTLDKERLLNTIKQLDRENYVENIIKISTKLKVEIGFEIKDDICKLGNFELYNTANNNGFTVDIDDKSSEKIIIIQKILEIQQDVIINITYWSHEDMLINKIKHMDKSDKKIEFILNEDIDRLKIIIWSEENGEIIYWKDICFLRMGNCNVNIQEGQYILKDDWSTKLRKSSAKESEAINTIEKVDRYTRESFNITNNKNKLEKVIFKSKQIQKLFNNKAEKGFFIDKTNNKSGEINSFLKIKAYLEESDIKKCIIVDPFFSIISASKMLGRINNMNLELEIIFSLSNTNPDTNDINSNLIEDYKKFMDMNKNLLHNNLKLINILSGKSQAFHDRYLIRYYQNGSVDGFLLSNSINSMGQKYPFVSAPLEVGVLREIINYIKDIKHNRSYNVDIIYDSAQRNVVVDSNDNKMEIIELYKKLVIISNNKLDVFENDVFENFENTIKNNQSDIVQFFIKECKYDKIEAFQALSLLMYISNEVKNEVESNFNVHNIDIEYIKKYLKETLIKDNITQKNPTFMSLKQKLNKLKEKSQITNDDIYNIRWIFNQFISEHEVSNKYAFGMIDLLLQHNSEEILNLLYETESPLIYIKFIHYLSLEWNEHVFMQLLNSNIATFKELGYMYAYTIIVKKNIEVLKKIAIQCRDYKYEFLCFVLTEINNNCEDNTLDELKDYIFEELIRYLDINTIDSETLNRLTLLLRCNDEKKFIKTIFNIENRLKTNEMAKKEFLNYIFEDVRSLIENNKNYYTIESDSEMFCIGAYSFLNLKNNVLSEADIKELLSKKEVLALGNPCLQDIDYNKWNNHVWTCMKKFIFISHLLNQYKGDNLKELINFSVIYLNAAMIGIRNNKHDYIIFCELLEYLAGWIRLGYIDEKNKKQIYKVIPIWARVILILNDKQYDINELENLISTIIKFDFKNDSIFITATIGEYIVVREILETDATIKEKFKNLREYFVERYLDDKQYKEYLNCLAKRKKLENTEWKTRGFGYNVLKKMRDSEI